ncbi:hypothetical protein [Pseudoxanthomonas composti]|uniref:Lipoprotein n=1 Tax=Pseudoxanthomonas composti TaxID=2137479 RepID=A0A4Q1JY43_9GAMM|nr:hypothetical protein [Pseudoxanthomonas composti]RXR07260.1 hypothetical protein EPA99_04905 [Pseudoxanthomonas composti]
MRILIPLLLSLIALVGCGRGDNAGPSREERMKPRIAVTNDAVTMRRAPAASAFIDPQGVLKIDDIQVPQSPDNTALLRLYFGRMQMLRLQTLGPEANSGKPGSVKAQPDAETLALQTQILQQVSPLKPYKESFDNVQMEYR